MAFGEKNLKAILQEEVLIFHEPIALLSDSTALPKIAKGQRGRPLSSIGEKTPFGVKRQDLFM